MKFNLLITIVVVIVVMVVVTLRIFGQKTDLKGATVKIGNDVFAVHVARTAIEKAQGLSGRESLGKDEGMLFLFDQPESLSFWMQGMKFPIDILWISQGKVQGITANIPLDTTLIPKLYPPPKPVETVLEINAGETKRRNIHIGDSVEIHY